MKVLVIGNGGREHALVPGKRLSRRWLKLFLLLRVMQALRWNPRYRTSLSA